MRFARLAPGPIGVAGELAASSVSAIALIVVAADGDEEMEAWLGTSGVPRVPVSGMRVARLFGSDDAVVARPAGSVLHCMPHGGRASIEAVCAGLERSGCERAVVGGLDPRALHPAARSRREAIAMALMGVSVSPWGVDVLAAQGGMDGGSAGSGGGVDAELWRLLIPPTVAAVGGANIGKSTLLNALARRRAAVVSDEPGTTRDHVGVMLVLDGLAVRWIDTPGIRALDPGGSASDAVEGEARARGERAIAGADLVVACADHDGAFPDVSAWTGGDGGRRVVWVRLRMDRCGRGDCLDRNGDSEGEDVVRTSVPGGGNGATGLGELARAVRGRLVSDAWLARAMREPMAIEVVWDAMAAGGFARGEGDR